MNEFSFDMLLEQVKRLSPKERLRIVEVLASGLQTEWIDETDWHAQ